MKSLLNRSNQRSYIIEALATAIKKRITIRYQSKVERICAKALTEIVDGTTLGNDLDLHLSDLIDYRNPADDRLLSIYCSLLTRLGYGDDPIMSHISNPGNNTSSTLPSDLVLWNHEIHVSKTGDDSFGIGTTTCPLASLHEAIYRLPRKINSPVEIILHENPALVGTDIQTVYDIRQSESIIKTIEFGRNGSLVIYGQGQPVTEMDQPVTTIAVKPFPKAGTQHNVGLGMIDKKYRGSFLVTNEANQLGRAQPIAENYQTTIYTRGFNTAPSSPRVTKIVKPRVVVVHSGIQLFLDGYRGEEPILSFYNLQFKFDPSYAENRSFPIYILGTGTKRQVLFDFVSIIGPLSLINPGQEPFGQVVMFKNLKVNYNKISGFNVPVKTGNTVITNWIGTTVSGTDCCGLSLGQQIDFAGNVYEWLFILNLENTFFKDVSMSNGIQCGGTCKIENGLSAQIAINTSYNTGGRTTVQNWAITGLYFYGIFSVQSHLQISNLYFFRSTTAAGCCVYCIYTEESSTVAQSIGCNSSITGQCINDRGGSHFLIMDDPVNFSAALGKIFFPCPQPNINVAAWPAAGAGSTDGLGGWVVRYGPP